MNTMFRGFAPSIFSSGGRESACNKEVDHKPTIAKDKTTSRYINNSYLDEVDENDRVLCSQPV